MVTGVPDAAALQLRTTIVPEWPRLAWLAVCTRGTDAVHVYAGAGVEVADTWACEAVWDAPFAEGGFDVTDRVFGSGVRVRGDAVTFVSSATTVDRLQTYDDGRRVHVSNSLPCLMSAVGESLDPGCTRYGAIGRSIAGGPDEYERELPTTGAPVRLTYFDNLQWDGEHLHERSKPIPRRDFATFERYHSFLAESVGLLVKSGRASERSEPFSFIGTTSSGYDSPTVSVLARDAGCREVFGFDRSRGGRADSGAPIAAILGLEYHGLSTTAWRDAPDAVVPFLSAIASGGSSVSYRAAEPLVRHRVVFTGYQGDRMWGTRPIDPGKELARVDCAGTDLTEYRLWAGFVHCPVPFLAATQLQDVRAISTSPEMGPWRLGTDYDRPVCRRIVEEAGVPRDLFGHGKKATAQPVLGADDFLTPSSRDDFSRWLRRQRESFRAQGTRVPGRWDDARAAIRGRIRRAGAPAPPPSRGYAFHWAVERAKERYDRDGHPGLS